MREVPKCRIESVYLVLLAGEDNQEDNLKLIQFAQHNFKAQPIKAVGISAE
ncbi:hypothetical protein S101258_00274 [Lactiplantibacillus plantarum subsp. plantarum]|uniref:Uncharacterized protein n=1 Tax=Lactiplantibacillus plantarum subsp. plantarum TaxID=337330 RepID=A0A2S3U9J4_LACPN|nr:hypothetical protein S101258_00274 [Lactiplantibacillus plantarum subsp. plantarum]